MERTSGSNSRRRDCRDKLVVASQVTPPKAFHKESRAMRQAMACQRWITA